MEAAIKKILSERKKIQIIDKDRIDSAVLIPIYKDVGDYHIVFIRRTETVKVHKGQISFPGGTRDATDATLLDTAMREAMEEIGLQAGDVTLLGELDDEITTTSNFIVTPFVAMIPWPYPLTKMDIETTDGGIVLDSYNFYYRGNVVWGATARILKKFLDIIGGATRPKPVSSS